MRINLQEMSLSELNAHLEAVQKAIQTRKSVDKAIAKRELADKAKELGFSIDELFGAAGRRARSGSEESETLSDGRATVAPKYAHPRDPSLTWTGRGRAPKWVVALEQEGVDRDAMLIAKN
jgi:DNA-binding protein H-NS